MRKIAATYLSYHKNNVNKFLHIIGIPMVLFGVLQLFRARWKTGVICFLLGYLLQWIGHAYLEKNEVGELAVIKKLVRKLKKS